MQTINAKQVKQKLDNGEDVVVINALPPESFQAKHIPGSVNIPASKIKNLAEQILPDPNQTIIVHCSNTSCSASSKAAYALDEMEYVKVYDFEAGLTGWLKAGFELISIENR